MPKPVLFFIFLLLAFPLLAQQARKAPAKTPAKTSAKTSSKTPAKAPAKTAVAVPNSEQLKHLKIYKEISNEVLSGKIDTKKSFLRYYEIFSTSAEELEKSNISKADEMKIKAEEALDNNKEPLSQKYKSASELFSKMAEEAAKFPALYKAGNKTKMDASIKAYLESEADLMKMGAKPCPRRWLATKEAEACLVNIYSKKTTKQK